MTEQAAREIHSPVPVQRRQAAMAMRWEPWDMSKAGAMIGWLLARGADFYHPGPGTGDETCLAFRYHGSWTGVLARPGDWVILEAGEFRCCPPDRYEETFAESPSPAVTVPAGLTELQDHATRIIKREAGGPGWRGTAKYIRELIAQAHQLGASMTAGRAS